ncbi:helix-turn-helix domain-containing protein [Alistipes sp. i18-0019-D1]
MLEIKGMETEKSLQNFAPTGSCPVRDVLCRLGDKWSMLVLLTLDANGVMRFSEIHRTLGDISHRMLTVTLRMLETDGMIRREVYAEVPPRVEYSLTERGGSLLPHIFGLVEWAEANKEAILDGRRRS